jgi:lipid-binding SYLF domain-containing protein
MKVNYFRHKILVVLSGFLAFAGYEVPSAALAANQPAAPNQAYTASDTVQQVNEARAVVEKMKSDPQLKKLLGQAKGVFIVPTYGRGGWGIGIRGGEGVMLTQSDHKWSNPVFYNLGGISIGFQGGIEAGSLAMLLMTDNAVNKFMSDNNFSINAGAGLTLVNYSGKAQIVAGQGDVIVWVDTTGAFANATVGATDIRFDQSDTQDFYKRTATAKEILSGAVTSPQAHALKQALPTGN